MTTNPYINWKTDTAEQDLIQDLTTEVIQCFGLVATYLPRTMRREDELYNEDILSNYTQVYTIEAYFKNVLGWTGAGNMMTKFGIQTQDEATLLISRTRFAESFEGSGLDRPMEGDLIYLGSPIDALFEIVYVDHEKAGNSQFYPLGKLNFYELRLVLHTYNQEEFATSNTDINAFQTGQQFLEAVGSPNPTDDNQYLQNQFSTLSVSEE